MRAEFAERSRVLFLRLARQAERLRLGLHGQAQRLASAVAKDGEFDLFADRQFGDNSLQLAWVLDRLAGDLDEDVAVAHATPRGGGTTHNLGDHYAGLAGDVEAGGDVVIKRRRLHTEVAACDVSVALQLIQDMLGEVA